MKTREISLLLNWERRWGTKSDCAVKRMCRDEKNHELVWQKTHREAKAVVLGRRKISPLFLHSWTHCLYTLRWTNYVIFLISKKQVFKVRVRDLPAPCTELEGSGRRGCHRLCEDAVTSGVELHSPNGSRALIFFNARAEQRTHLFICGFMTCFGMPLLCPLWGRGGGRWGRCYIAHVYTLSVLFKK